MHDRIWSIFSAMSLGTWDSLASFPRTIDLIDTKLSKGYQKFRYTWSANDFATKENIKEIKCIIIMVFDEGPMH